MDFGIVKNDFHSAMDTIRANESSISLWNAQIQQALETNKSVRMGAIKGLREDVFDEARMLLRRHTQGFVFKKPFNLVILNFEDDKGKKGRRCSPSARGGATELKLSRNGKRELPTIVCTDGNEYDITVLDDASVEALAEEIWIYEQEHGI